ncbi:MAG: hypothetical protein HDS69_10370 [Bacteroidales bacterium]|nr:hypothetical protein [Bacteroidales bacterium]MBD5230418.1 hypothetical protein [Bacteroidales bacterium]
MKLLSKLIVLLGLCVISPFSPLIHAQTNWIKCFEPNGFTVYYNTEKNDGTIELKDYFPCDSDRLDFAGWIGVDVPIASLIWKIEVSSELSKFRVIPLKGYDERGKFADLVQLKTGIQTTATGI